MASVNGQRQWPASMASVKVTVKQMANIKAELRASIKRLRETIQASEQLRRDLGLQRKELKLQMAKARAALKRKR